MRLNRQQVIERLKAGEKLEESGNTMVFSNGDSCTGATEIYLRENGLVNITGDVGRLVYSWPKSSKEELRLTDEGKVEAVRLEEVKMEIIIACGSGLIQMIKRKPNVVFSKADELARKIIQLLTPHPDEGMLIGEEKLYLKLYGEKFDESLPDELYKYLPANWDDTCKAQLAHCDPLIRKDEREKIFKRLL